jgi:polysaccharide biosynthesis transport protein
LVGKLRPEGAMAGSVERYTRPAGWSRSESSPRRLEEGLAVLGQRKWSILSVTLIAIAIALLVSSRQTPIYRSQATILVMTTDVESTAPNLETELRLISSVAVAEIVADTLEIPGNPRKLLDDLAVERPTDTEILEISYSDPDPAEAQRIAQGFAEGYLAYRQGAVTEELLRSAEELQTEQEALGQRLSEIERRLARLASFDPRRRTLETEAAALQQLILQRQLDLLRVPESVVVGKVLQSAASPSTPVSPNHVLNGGLGLVAGLALGVGLAFVRDRLSGRLRSIEEVEVNAGADVLGSIPQLSAWRRRKQAFLVTRSQRHSSAAEAYRILRTNVLSVASDYDAKSVVVTSAQAGEGKSATVANLGMVMATAGKRVSLVSADLRRPRLHEFFDLDGRYGLADVLAGRMLVDDALHEITLPRPPGSRGMDPAASGLRVLPSGLVPENPAELLSSDTMNRILRDLEESSDIVLIDAPPIMAVTDALVVALAAQGVFLVIGPRGVERSSVVSARQQLDKAGARLLGVVLNGPDISVVPTYYGH